MLNNYDVILCMLFPLLQSETEFDNCIPLHEALQLSWKVDNDNSNVRFRLCGCQSIDSK